MTPSGNVVWKLLLAGVTVCKSQLIGRLSTSQRQGLFVFRRRTCLMFRFGSSSAIMELSLCFSKILAKRPHDCVLRNSFASPSLRAPESATSRPRPHAVTVRLQFPCSHTNSLAYRLHERIAAKHRLHNAAPPPSSGHVAFGPLALPPPRSPAPRPFVPVLIRLSGKEIWKRSLGSATTWPPPPRRCIYVPDLTDCNVLFTWRQIFQLPPPVLRARGEVAGGGVQDLQGTGHRKGVGSCLAFIFVF